MTLGSSEVPATIMGTLVRVNTLNSTMVYDSSINFIRGDLPSSILSSSHSGYPNAMSILRGGFGFLIGSVINTAPSYTVTCIGGSASCVDGLLTTGKFTPDMDLVTVFSVAKFTMPDFICNGFSRTVLDTTASESPNITVHSWI